SAASVGTAATGSAWGMTLRMVDQGMRRILRLLEVGGGCGGLSSRPDPPPSSTTSSPLKSPVPVSSFGIRTSVRTHAPLRRAAGALAGPGGDGVRRTGLSPYHDARPRGGERDVARRDVLLRARQGGAARPDPGALLHAGARRRRAGAPRRHRPGRAAPAVHPPPCDVLRREPRRDEGAVT